MKKVSAKSYTRVTLALDIIGKLAEGPFAGYHELAAIKHAIDLHDVLTVEESSGMRIVCDNPRVPATNANSCWKAAELFKAEFGIGRNVTITIEKNIPVQGGLAGGSANAATMMRLLRELWNLDVDDNKLAGLSRRIGMDVPFFFFGGTALDTEAGGTVTPLSTSLRFDAILAFPDFGVPTPEAYRGLDYRHAGLNRTQTNAMRHSLSANDRAGVCAAMHNDFESSVFSRYPQLSIIKKNLLDAGCAAALMSGSGSTMMGILETSADFEKIQKKIGVRSVRVTSCPE